MGSVRVINDGAVDFSTPDFPQQSPRSRDPRGMSRRDILPLIEDYNSG